MPDFTTLNVIELYKSHAALESSLNLGGPEAERALADCDSALLDKIDALHVVLKNAEREIEHWKEEAKLVAEARRSAQSTVDRIKSLLQYVKTAAPKVGNKLIGRNYKFTLVKQKNEKVELTTPIEEWDAFEKLDFAYEECITTTTVVQSVVGDTVSRTSATKTRLIPNLDAIRHAYRTAPESLPRGVRVTQAYSIRTGRVATCLARPPSHPDHVLCAIYTVCSGM